MKIIERMLKSLGIPYDVHSFNGITPFIAIHFDDDGKLLKNDPTQ